MWRILQICKFFIEAVEKSKYGWFWECPGGAGCIYRHALPPGFVLKKDLKAMQKENKENETSLEDWIETERHKLGAKHATLTKVTMETFVAWKKRKIQERKDEKKKMEDKKLRDFKAGNKIGVRRLRKGCSERITLIMKKKLILFYS